ncbi:MAG: ATP phosphoribosyltransferase regulatory subunit, partial [Parasporobacterium sp.]|nr:ATP phosphoribosyltransferase regulatory subunit [Parasporobacterium sp.]
VYYNENVYRISDKTHCYKEIMQTGVEALGDITEYNLLEVMGLAVKSLQTVSENSVLNLSHLGLLKEALSGIEGDEHRSLIVEALRNKNRHELESVLEKAEAPEASSKFLKYMASAFGNPSEVLNGLQKYASSENVKQCMAVLKKITDNISSFGNIKVRIDLSLAGDMNYYNGLIFEGYVEGIPQAVLKGGQYDSLLKKLNKKGGAIGFAVYLDELERLKAGSGYDVDVLLIAGPEVPYETVIAKTNELIAAGRTVSVQKTPAKNLIYKEMVEL